MQWAPKLPPPCASSHHAAISHPDRHEIDGHPGFLPSLGTANVDRVMPRKAFQAVPERRPPCILGDMANLLPKAAAALVAAQAFALCFLSAAEPVDFGSQVQPILSDRCY